MPWLGIFLQPDSLSLSETPAKIHRTSRRKNEKFTTVGRGSPTPPDFISGAMVKLNRRDVNRGVSQHRYVGINEGGLPQPAIIRKPLIL